MLDTTWWMDKGGGLRKMVEMGYVTGRKAKK